MPEGSAYDGFFAHFDGSGNSEVTLLTPITAHVTVDYELVARCQQAGDRPHKGTPLGTFREMWPFDLLKRELVSEAKRFISQVKSHGYQAIEPFSAMKVWGPYTEKVGAPRDWTPEAGNHVIPKHQQRTAAKVWGYQGDEFNFEKGCAFLIQGRFTRYAGLGKVDEETGVILA